MDAYHSDDEFEKLKAWWKSYGTSVILGIVLGGALLGGMKYWKQYKHEQAAQASVLYDEMLAAGMQGNAAAAEQAGNKVVSDFSSTPYAGKAALVLARLSYDASDRQKAQQHLQWAVDNASEDVTRHVARLRLARLLLDEGKADEAISLADVKDMGGFVSEYQELRGDVHVLRKQIPEARIAYRAALDAVPKGSPYTRVLSMKYDSLGTESGK